MLNAKGQRKENIMMNTGLTINTAANTIEMTKEFARKAKYFGTDEYKLLQDARKDYPTFSVATRKTVSKESYKGLTINYMYNYIKKHPQTLTLEDGNEVKALEVFTEIAGLDENGKKMANVETAFYGEIRAWFLDIYPEVKNKKDNIKKLLTAKKKQAEAKEDKVVNMKQAM